jgi:acyl carrier protein
MTKLYQSLAEILMVDEVHSDQELQGFDEWDSLAALSLVVSVRTNYDVVITTADLRRITTVGDLEKLVQSKQPQANPAK